MNGQPAICRGERRRAASRPSWTALVACTLSTIVCIREKLASTSTTRSLIMAMAQQRFLVQAACTARARMALAGPSSSSIVHASRMQFSTGGWMHILFKSKRTADTLVRVMVHQPKCSRPSHPPGSLPRWLRRSVSAKRRWPCRRDAHSKVLLSSSFRQGNSQRRNHLPSSRAFPPLCFSALAMATERA